MNKGLYDTILKKYPDVKIVMASKYLETYADFKPFLEHHVYRFGENRDDAFLDKYALLKDHPIEWHFIGTLQTKKVKKVIDKIDVLHALDRLKLAEEINKRRQEALPCYLQVNISSEPQKHGFEMTELKEVIKTIKTMKNIRLIGLMGMAEDTNDKTRIKAQFEQLRALRNLYQKEVPTLTELSMGMSQDYDIALEVGTTVLRLGRILLDGGNVWDEN